jgi:hypothetical protein
MSPSIKQKTAIPVFLVAIVLACFAILRSVQAAEPNGIQAVNIFNMPFQRDGFAIIRPGGGFDNVVFDIPAGKTLVVEFVSVFGDFPAGEQATQLSISTSGAQAFPANLRACLVQRR